MSERTLIRGGCVLTLDPELGELPQGIVRCDYLLSKAGLLPELLSA